MTKREYLSLLISMPSDWIEKSLASPSGNMKPTHIALHHIALRRKAKRASR